MDLVTKNLVSTFSQEQTLPNDLDASTIFEHFSNFCVLSREYGEEFEIEDVHTGGGDDLGIDGLAIIVNGVLVNDASEVEDLANTNKHLKVEFIFCQAKSGGNFSGSEISNFFFGIKDIFSDKPTLPRNKKIEEKEVIIQTIYSKSALFKNGNPIVSAYYVCTGSWQDDAKLQARIQTEKDSLLETNIFSEVNFTPVDARLLQQLFNSAKNRLSVTIIFAKKLTLPKLPGVEESYLGYLPANEYLKLITDEGGGIGRNLFYDNVRDFQGNDNNVNEEIEETLKSDSQRDFFVLMNNGVTIVAESLNKTGDAFTIEDYQIVNGCQTSHVLYNNAKLVNENVHIPIKLIISKNDTIKNQVIKATNRQTPVKPEELTALTDFQKALEEYYIANKGEHQLYYERRSQQYRSATGIEKIRIVSISNQIRSFSSMFLNLPHQASRYYGTLLESVENKIFVNGHPMAAYYASALALYRFEGLVRRKQIDAKYRPFKYHLLAIARLLHQEDLTLSMTSNKFDKYCQNLVETLNNNEAVVKLFFESTKILEEILGGDFNRDKAKDTSIFNAAEQLVQQKKSVIPKKAAEA